jgi:hypothetical protein
MSKKTTTQETLPVEQKGVLPALLDEMSADAGTGFENTTSADFLIPFLRVIQANSPQMDPQHAKYIEAAKLGMFVNTATNEIMKTVRLLPCAYRREIIEWAPRDSKEGIVARYPVESGIMDKATRNEKGKLILDNGNSLVDTRYIACLKVDEEGSAEPVVVSMASTQIKVARGWMTRMDNLKFTAKDGTRKTEPIFSRIWSFKTVQERNAQGTWYSWNIESDGMPVGTRELYQAAKDFRESFLSGAAKIDETAETEAGTAAHGESAADTVDAERVM